MIHYIHCCTHASRSRFRMAPEATCDRSRASQQADSHNRPSKGQRRLLAVLMVGSLLLAPACQKTKSGVALDTPDTSGRDAQVFNQLTKDEIAQGWILLFDGETTFGWKHDSNADWSVEDGAVVVSLGDMSLLYTSVQFSDYVLKVDFRSEPGTNSGIFLSTSPDPADVASDCYELNIAGQDNPYPTGSLVQRAKVEGDHESDAWQSYEVRVEKGNVNIMLDGKEILTYVDPAPIGRGHIGLQRNAGKVQFRNIKLKPLGLAEIFNGEDLAGWKTYPDMESEFSVTEEGDLHVRNGRGQLESEQSYGDFVLQLQCISHAPGLNSGLFFRCIPGETMNGYESQIQNEYLENDPSKPKDCGTGGIFRRQNARRVVAKDLEWFTKTIVADGPHFAVWVNGFQVTDWTDTRDPDANPRKGLRIEPGTLMIQGHDPTTDLSFRQLFAAELRPR